ncbi:thiol reductant ABC exporter subunit CydC [Oecophyllibacter saccharovorans]|uniref:thiol reductant ABC exporter subunit CydC n=1 Tax=Oecophyllibacter saccharovorans TaxID=2558360 RepID=UPI0011448B6A|nr:thiol reductant ABC exporter subunit CydC [Oecophyllibacter saccharovorans]QDH14968.1 thiol reductant ABC exporter subunit CydC [Oecophyllibacter saccharovorans]
MNSAAARNHPAQANSLDMKPFLRPMRGLLLLGLALSCLATLSGFGLLFLSGWFLAAAAVAGLGGAAAQNAFNMFTPAAGVRLFALTRILARYLERLATHDAALRATGELRSWSFRRLIPRSVPLVILTRSGDLLSRFVQGTEVVGQYPLDVLLPCLNALLCAVVVVAVTALFAPAAGAVLAIGLMLGGVVLPWLTGLLTARAIEREAAATDVLRSDILECLQGMADLLSCGAAGRRLDSVAARQGEIRQLSFTIALRANLVRQMLPMLAVLAVLAVLLVSDRGFLAGTLQAPELPMLALGCLAAFEIVAPLNEARMARSRFQRAARQVKEVCSLPCPVKEIPEAGLPTGFGLELRDVSFRFLPPGSTKPGRHDRDLLRHLNLRLEEGERVAIVGPSGAGKTTLIRLVMRLLDPTEGQVFLDGVDLRRLTTLELSRPIGVLMQNPHLFQGSLRRNLLIACPQATESDMQQALSVVGLADEVRQMPGGLDTPCGEQGVRLSGGQLRRFAAAQILLRRPRVLVLDEPTESLPPEAGRALMANMLEALPGASVLCITHRPEPLAFMNRVYRLENGRLIAESARPGVAIMVS